MEHLTDDQIYDLAKKILNEGPFSYEDTAAMHHIADCTECYNMLMCTMALMDVTANIASFAKPITLADEPIELLELS